MTTAPLVRGLRRRARIEFATAPWVRNEFGVGVLTLSRDDISGAETFALDCPPDFVFPEEAHFYDCEQDLFQFEGEFHHDELAPYHAGDYVYRPVGTVYGHGEGSRDGGIIVASLARERRRFHFQGHPEPWMGHYLVDQLWNPRPVRAFIVNQQSLGWEGDSQQREISWRALRGQPGERSAHSGASRHSPWAADAVFVLRIEGGYSGAFPQWPGFLLEVLTLAGRGMIAGERWHRGCYAFDATCGHCTVTETLEMYVRSFAVIS